MTTFKKVKITMDGPNIKQRLILWSANFLLWLAIKLFKDDKERLKSEIADVTKMAINGVILYS